MFEEEKQDLKLAEDKVIEHTLNKVKEIMARQKNEIINYAENHYNSDLRKVMDGSCEISKKQDCFLVEYAFSSIGYSFQEVRRLSFEIELGNELLNEFFDIMEEGNKYKSTIDRIEDLNWLLRGLGYDRVSKRYN